MDRPETIRLLRVAHDEIITLRREVADLAPRAHAYDTIAQLARLTVKPDSRGMAVDIAWELKAAVQGLEAEREAEREIQRTDAQG